MPSTTALSKLQVQAAAGNTSFISTTNGAAGEAQMRLEFIAIDLNGDGLTNGANEGFMRVYQVPSGNIGWLSATRPASATSNFLRNEDNCGHVELTGQFVTAAVHGTVGDSWNAALTSASRRCFLGGADELNAPDGFVANDGKGSYIAWPGAVSPLLAARADKNYLFPLSRALNPTFKGVIYVAGKVMVSGVVRSRITIAASDNIIIGDDLTYATNPATGTCVDIIGLFSAKDIVIADNLINDPTRVTDATSGTYYTMDNTKDEFLHGVALALNIFTVQNYNSGPNNSSTGRENCETTAWGRGCLYLTGGVIQATRGAVGLLSGEGNLKRYSYDACAFSNPPPYFPTTGHFAMGHYFEIDPTGFNITTYFDLLAAGT
jgi:hypothetical protein